MKRLLIAVAMAATLAGCATPMQKVTLTSDDVKGLANDRLVMCAYAGDLPPVNGVLESDPNGVCKAETVSRLKAGTLSKEEYQIDLDSAKGQVQQAMQMAQLRQQQKAAADAEDSREWNTIIMANAICAGSLRGC